MTRVRRRLHSLRRLASLFDECFALEGMFEASTSKFNMIISILLAEMHSPAYRQTEMLQESTEYMHLLISVGNFEPHQEMMLSQTSNLCHLDYPNLRYKSRKTSRSRRDYFESGQHCFHSAATTQGTAGIVLH